MTMKSFATITAIIIASICVATHSIPAHSASKQIIALLNTTPTQTITDCTPEDLMNLLTDTSKEWVENIECYNVNINKGKSGVTLEGNAGTEAYIKFNFKPGKAMQMINLKAYCEDLDNYGINIVIDCNGDFIANGSVGLNGNLDNYSAKEIYESIDKGDLVKQSFGPSIRFDPVIPVKSLKIYIPSNTSLSYRIKFYAFAIYYDSIVEPEEEIMTSVDEIQLESQSPKEYYDLMGRKLPSEPQSGLYILKTSSKVEKRIANNK